MAESENVKVLYSDKRMEGRKVETMYDPIYVGNNSNPNLIRDIYPIEFPTLKLISFKDNQI